MKRSICIVFIILLTGSVLFSRSEFSPASFSEFSHYIYDKVNENNIPGLSIAITDGKTILWEEALGFKNAFNKDTLDMKTIFSIQSMSKTLTATAVMFAVQEGLVDLDEPITTYLPRFKVHSVFEKHPEQKMTLRLLLSHRAGFTHEAPEGNNYEWDYRSYPAHIRSISDTWLKAPVGAMYSYSNLGIDLAGYIIEKVSGMPFPEYVKTRIFDPLEMNSSSFDWQAIERSDNRATGYNSRNDSLPLTFAMIPAGGCYTNAEDMANFMIFHMNKGKFHNKQILKESLLDEMYDVPANCPVGYALGIEKRRHEGYQHFYHSGGGYGFQSHMEWLPELEIGVVILTNSANHDNVHKKISRHIIETLTGIDLSGPGNPDLDKPYPDKIELSDIDLTGFNGMYLMADGSQSFKFWEKDGQFGADAGFFFIPFNFFSTNRDLYVTGFGPEMDGYYTLRINDRTGKPWGLFSQMDEMILCFNEGQNDPPGPNKKYWQSFIGTYERKIYDRVISTHEIKMINGYLYFDDFRLDEHPKKIFYLPNGEVLNFRTKIPTFRNIDLIKKE